ncbi:MAG: DUF2190 family protein [Geobacteraceae bacterium]|nr:DUF2190 family protein [Geobacteraceae bacterium]
MRPGDRYNYYAQGVIPRYRFVKFGDADGKIAVAGDATAPIIAVCHDIDLADGERGDVVRDDMPQIEYGEAINHGDFITAGAGGKAFKAVKPAGGTTTYYGGIAEYTGVAGDICPMMFQPGVLFG